MAYFTTVVVRIIVLELLTTACVVSSLGCTQDSVTVPPKRAPYERPVVQVQLPSIPETLDASKTSESICATIHKNSDVTFRCQFASETPQKLLATIKLSRLDGSLYYVENLWTERKQTRLAYYNQMPISCLDTGEFIVEVIARPRPVGSKAGGPDSISIQGKAQMEVVAKYRISVIE